MATRIKLTVDDDWLAAMQKASAKRSQNVSEWVRCCILHRLPKTEQKKLKEIQVGRPKTK